MTSEEEAVLAELWDLGEQWVGFDDSHEYGDAVLQAVGKVWHPPCCDACGGAGGDRNGPCWDCRGTGHPHP